MTLEQILEIIERYKLRIPPTVYYDLKADIVNCSEIPTGLTTKNDIHCLYTDEEIAQSFKEDVEAVKDLLPTTKNDLGVDLISRVDAINAVSEALKHTFVEHEDIANKIIGNLPSVTTKNNLAVDCISRADAIKAVQDKAKKLKNEDTINGLCGAVAILFDMPSVTPQEPFINPHI